MYKESCHGPHRAGSGSQQPWCFCAFSAAYLLLDFIAQTQSSNMRSTSSSPLRAALALASLASARKCLDLTVDVPVVSRNAVFNLSAPTSDIEVINFVLDFTRQSHNLTNEVLTGVGPTLSSLQCLLFTLTIISMQPSRRLTPWRLHTVIRTLDHQTLFSY